MTEMLSRLSPLYHKLRSKFAERFGLNDPDAPAPIVPEGNLAGSALMFVIAIMTFLASLTIGAVSIVRDTASTWQSQISREATIQIRPVPDLDMQAALETARGIAAGFDGVGDARIVSPDDTKRLLEPWLGTDFDMDSLPVPRLVISPSTRLPRRISPSCALTSRPRFPARRWTTTATGWTGW